MPAAIAASGDSPTARVASPLCVRAIHHAIAGASRYNRYVTAGWANSARPTMGIDDNHGIANVPMVGVESATPPTPNTVRYSVPVSPSANSVIAVPVMI